MKANIADNNGEAIQLITINPTWTQSTASLPP